MLVPLAAMLSAAFVLAGCQTPKAASPPPSGAARSTRNNCYSLLHQLTDDEKDVSILLKNLIKRIATTSETTSTLLEQFARDDPSIRLDDFGLPPGEAATRDSIASTKQKELLGQTGDEFELTLLLTQTEALGYAWHLAKVAAENEPQPDRARALTGVSEDMEKFYDEREAALEAGIADHGWSVGEVVGLLP
jgi:hypothetical protein